MKEENKQELVIVGAGPAGMTASIYASRYGIKNLVVGEVFGGLMFEAHKICNYPSEREISGFELVNKMKGNVEALGARMVIGRIEKIEEDSGGFRLITREGEEFWARAVLLATGTEHRKLGLPNEDKLSGHGVSYCATCDAMFYKGKTVVVVGGSDSANTAALYLAEVADKVYQIYRGEKLRGEKMWSEQVMNNGKIEVIFNTKIKGLVGAKKLEKVELSRPYNGRTELEVEGLFVEAGTLPEGKLAGSLDLAVNESGYIQVDVEQRTSRLGIWAAGDITDASNGLKQIVTACSEGTIAAESVFKFLQSQRASLQEKR